MSGTRVASGAALSVRWARASRSLAVFLATGALATVAFAGPTSADQVSSLNARAKSISQELVQEQLQADAYQQQYSVASAQVVHDEQAIAATRLAISGDHRQIARKEHQVSRLAVESYILNGSDSSSSGAALFAENVATVQAANEYTTITVGNVNVAVDQLHTAQRLAQSQQQTLLQQTERDKAEQTAQADDLSQANATVSQMESVQSQVTGELATAVAQQQAAQTQVAVAAVSTAKKATGQKTGPDPPPGAVSTNTTDPALNPFLTCVVQAESGGDYQAVSPNGLYMGAFQFSQPTWNYAARAAGRPDLVGVPPNRASKPDQDTLAVALFALDGERPWLGDRCSR
jgi:hypothetical protein